MKARSYYDGCCKGIRKRMATVAAVYSIERTVRSAESITGMEAEQDPSPKPRARNKRVWASVQRAPHEVTEEVEAMALRRDPERQRPWVMLVDGHEGQLEHIHACKEPHPKLCSDVGDVQILKW